MGKNSKKAKVKGIEKTLNKELKKSNKKIEKELNELGQDDIKTTIAKFEEANKSIKLTSEVKCDPPSVRCNMTLNAHPEKDILIMFGGEYYNGKETKIFGDLFFYHIRTKEWSLVTIPNAPAPRCSHQAVVLPQSGGQLWLFGGEYVTPNQSHYFHYNDLWVLSLSQKKWDKISCPGGPLPRSGHRMVACKKMLFIFGGFQDNTMVYRYFNDVHAFNTETYSWVKLQLSGLPPSPRSGCVMAVTQDQCHIMVYGGYSKHKVKKDVDKGHVYSDMFILSLQGSKENQSPLSWKWSSIKQTGHIPTPRCSTSLCVTSSNRAVLFGGIKDEDENEEEVDGCCLNDMYLLEIDKGKWHLLNLKKPSDRSLVKKRQVKEKIKNRKKVKNIDECEEEDEDVDDDVDDDDIEEIGPLNIDAEKMKSTDLINSTLNSQPEISTESIFKVTVNSIVDAPSSNKSKSDDDDDVSSSLIPSPRMRPMLAAKRGLLYLYGGLCEEGSRQITLNDFYSIDLQRMTEWNVLLKAEDISMDWQGSSSEDEDDDDDEEDDDSSEDSNSDSEDEEIIEENDDPTASGPKKRDKETFDEYFTRTSVHWNKKAKGVALKEKIEASDKQINKAAYKIAQEYWQKISF